MGYKDYIGESAILAHLYNVGAVSPYKGTTGQAPVPARWIARRE